jgi:hypothetical protein
VMEIQRTIGADIIILMNVHHILVITVMRSAQ